MIKIMQYRTPPNDYRATFGKKKSAFAIRTMTSEGHHSSVAMLGNKNTRPIIQDSVRSRKDLC